MKKIDFKKELKYLYYASSKEVKIIKVPEMKFLMIDGEGDPNTSKDFQIAVEALYSLSYTLKFMIKKDKVAIDYGVLPLEGLWWMDDMTKFSMENKDDWKWTMMIMQPKYVNVKLVHQATEQVSRKKELPSLEKVRFESFNEGLSAQILHIGTYDSEEPTIKGLHKYVKDNDYELRDKHHEIYLNDPGRTAPEKMKTILRQPIRKLV
jgi:hypothetical protein